jgi:D-3-phosphoglycerate dehydrogenase / 2-oxoglutarate reductase
MSISRTTQHKPKVAITDHRFSSVDSERDVIEGAGGELMIFQCKTEAEVIEAARDADAMLVQWAPITASVISNLSRCKVIVRYGIGVDNVDLDAARQRGITVCNVPDYCIDEVADHTLALALALVRQLPATDAELRKGLWKSTPPLSMPAPNQMTFATVGLGRTAKAVLDRARNFKFRLAACDPYRPDAGDVAKDVLILAFDRLLETADVVSLHVPLNSETSHMIEGSALSRMKRGAFLINTARGGLIDTVALARALKAGSLAGAGLDVFEVEPLPADHPLLACENVLLTPHIAWYSQLSVRTLQRMAAEEAMRGLAGDDVRSKVS